MSILNIDEYATLQRAGFTRAQIAAHQTKFYNLFRVMPLSMTEMRQHRQLHEANRELLEVLKEILSCDKTRTSFGAVMRAREAVIKHGGAA